MSDRRARIAVIGTGWWATTAHIPALLANPRAELAAVCDADAGRLAAAAQEFGIGATYADHRELLAREQLDGAIVATPHATHYGLARDCLAAGLHTLIEKPMTLYAAHARELVQLAAQNGRELMVGYTWHYNSLVDQLRDLLASGELGRPQLVMCVFNSYCIDLYRGNDHSDRPGAYRVHGPGAVYSKPELSGGGHGHLQLTHSVGLMSYVTGLRPQRVIGLMHSHGLPVDLVDAITVEFAGGALGLLGGTSNAQPSNFDLQVHCEHGAVLVDLVAMSVRVRRHGAAEQVLALGEGEPHYPLGAPADNLVALALGEGANRAPGEPGWRTVEILDAAYRSAAGGGQPVPVESLYI